MNFRTLIVLLAIALVLVLAGCASTPKKGCIITEIHCPAYVIEGSQCHLVFDDSSDFYLPYSGAKYLSVDDSICK